MPQHDIAVCEANQNHLTFEKEALLAALDQWEGERQLWWASEQLRSCKEFMCQVVRRKPLALEYAAEDVKSDRQVVLIAAERNWFALRFAAATIRSDKKFVLAILAKHPLALQYVDASLTCDHEVVLTAVQQDGRALQYASEAVRSDREVVLAAVAQHVIALQYAAAALQSDKQFLLAAVHLRTRCFEAALRFASNSMRSDLEIFLAAVERHGARMLQHAAEASRADKHFVMSIMRATPAAIEYAAEVLRGDKEMVVLAVLHDPELFRHASKALRADEEVILAMSRQHGAPALDGVSHDLLLRALNNNEQLLSQLWLEIPSMFKNVFLFNVSLLSGRSCHFILTEQNHGGFQLRRDLLLECCRLLDLGTKLDLVTEFGELLHGAALLSDDDAIRTLRRGELHTLQLLLGLSKPQELN